MSRQTRTPARSMAATWACPAIVLLVLGLAGCSASTSRNPTTDPSPSSAGPVLGPEPLLPEPTDCAQLATLIVDRLQDWIDGFPATVTSGETTTEGPDTDLPTLAAELAPLATDLDCDPETMEPLVADELERLTAEGPLQQAAAGTLRADPLGTLDPSDPDPETRTVATGEELVAAAAEVGSGSTIELVAGTLEVDTPVVLMRPVTIRGSGPGDTVVSSSAEDASFVLTADGDVVLEDFSLARTGPEPGSGVVVIGGGYRLARLAISGARATATGAGGFGVVLLPRAGGLVRGGETFELREVAISDSTGGGVVIGGQATPDLVDLDLDGPDELVGCGLCWLDGGAGTVTDATVRGFGIGLRIDARAAPTIVGGTVAGAALGVAATGDGAPVLRRVALTGNDTGIELGGTTTAVLEGLRVEQSNTVGVRMSGGATPQVRDLDVVEDAAVPLAVVDDAAPTIQGGDLSTGGEVAALWGGRAGGKAVGLAVRDARIGVQVGDGSAPDLVDLVAIGVAEVALLATADSAGSLDGLVCDENAHDSVVLVEGTSLEVIDAGGCAVVDQPADG